MRQVLAHLRSWLLDAPAQTIRLGQRGPLGLLPISLPLHHFNTHLYVVGQSGQGKSKFLQHLLFQLVHTSWGCGVFDPHSDLASDLLAQLAAYPRHRPWLSVPANRQRLIYLDPARNDYLIPCNILASTTSTPYEVAENVVEAFRRVWPQTLAEAPRFAQILRNALVVLSASGLSLLELEPLLTDSALRRRWLANVADPQVVAFFRQQFDRWHGREHAIFIAPVLNKVDAILFKPAMRLMLGATENKLDFRRIMDTGAILVVDLGGFHDEETKHLLGSLLLTALEQAAFTRKAIPPHQRRPYFLLLDEFASFCARDATTLAKILSECRKYRLHLGLAHQTIAQLEKDRMKGALENAQLKVVFGTGRQTAQAIVGDLFLPDPRAIKHEVAEGQERSHPIFDPLHEQFETFTQTIQRLHRQQVVVKLPEHEHVVTARTPVVPPSRISPQHLEQWKTYLARQAGTPRREIEAAIAARTRAWCAPTILRGAGRHRSFWREVVPAQAKDTLTH